MVISQPPGNNPSYYYRAYQRCLNCSECFQRHLMFYTCCSYNIRVTHRNGAIKHIFYTNQIHGGIISRLFFIHCRAMRLLFILAVKILLQIFLYEDLSTLALRYICRLYFPPECQQDRTLLHQPILLSENIPNI